MESFVTPEYIEFANGLILKNLLAMRELFKKYNIAEEPNPETLMLAAIKYKDPFITDLSELVTMPTELMRADGGSISKKMVILSVFTKALDIANGVGTAAKVGISAVSPNTSQSQTAEEKAKTEQEENTYSIFGTRVKKITVKIVVGVVILGIVYFAWIKPSMKKSS